MLIIQQVDAREQVAQLEHTRQTALGILDVFEQQRAMCPGYNPDISSEEYRRACLQFEQASQQLAEAKSKITLEPKYRISVSRLINKVWSL